MTKDAFLQYCAALPGACLDQPFLHERAECIASTYVARHGDTGKWFAVIMERGGAAFATLKCDPAEAELLRQAFAGVRPGYHMNKRHWISVYLASDVPEECIRSLALASFRLTARRGGR